MIVLLTATLFLIAAGAAWRGAALLVRGIREADRPSGPVHVVRGFRGLTVGVGLGAASAGLLSAHIWLVAFGAIFLAEELYETGLLLLILRAGFRGSPGAQGRERMA
ncbi:MAG TPA: hypothetical protein VID04_14495 [Methylomirabilota bacterium]|jgi:hypothetical protein